MPVLYDGVELVSVATLDLSFQPRATDAGAVLGPPEVVATVRGDIAPDVANGVPFDLPPAQRLSAILLKQGAMRAALANSGRIFEVIPWDGSAPFRLLARPGEIEFDPEGGWLNSCRFTATFRGDGVLGDPAVGTPGIARVEERWSFQDEGLLSRATHTAGATATDQPAPDGKSTVPGWQVAKTYVLAKLGLGWATLSDQSLNFAAGQALAAASQAGVVATGAWSRAVVEEIDEAAGSYSATETFLLSNDPYWVESTQEVTRGGGENYTVSVACRGTIHGLYQGTGPAALPQRLLNAQAGWVAIKPNLLGGAIAAAGTPLCPIAKELTSTPSSLDGTIAYRATYNNRVLANLTSEVYKVATQAAGDQPTRKVTVSGAITGEIDPLAETDLTLRYARAEAQFARIRGALYQRATQASGITGLQLAPLEADSETDRGSGVLNYSYVFDDRLNTSVTEEYRASRSSTREDGRSTIVVSGTIRGLRADPLSPASSRTAAYQAAKAYYDGIKGSLLSRAASEADISTSDMQSDPVEDTFEGSTLNGEVSYQVKFVTGQRLFPFALSESVSVEDEDAVPVVVSIPVPGRAAGPIFQDLGTRRERRKSVTIELVLDSTYPPGQMPVTTIDRDQFAPAGSNLQEGKGSWVAPSNRYVYVASWIY